MSPIKSNEHVQTSGAKESECLNVVWWVLDSAVR